MTSKIYIFPLHGASLETLKIFPHVFIVIQVSVFVYFEKTRKISNIFAHLVLGLDVFSSCDRFED